MKTQLQIRLEETNDLLYKTNWKDSQYSQYSQYRHHDPTIKHKLPTRKKTILKDIQYKASRPHYKE